MNSYTYRLPPTLAGVTEVNNVMDQKRDHFFMSVVHTFYVFKRFFTYAYVGHACFECRCPQISEALASLRLELQVIVNHLETELRSSTRIAPALNH